MGKAWTIKTVFNHLAHESPALRREMDRTVRIALSKMDEDVLQSLEGPRSGRVYHVPGTIGAYHRASAPGEPPARLYGDLANSIGWKMARTHGLGQVPGTLYASAEHPPHLEFGTVNMARRPFFAPLARRWKPFLRAMGYEAGRRFGRPGR